MQLRGRCNGRIFVKAESRLPTNANVVEAAGSQLSWVEHVAAVYDQGARDDLTQAIPVHVAELLPFGRNQDGFRILGGLIGAGAVADIGKDCLRFLGCLGIVGTYDRALTNEGPQNLQSRGKANVVGIWLKRQAEDGDFTTADYPQLLPNFLNETLSATLVDVFHFFQQREITPGFRGDSHECLDIFREAEPAETDSGIQERGTDPGIRSHSQSNFGDIRPNSLAEISDHLVERNPHSSHAVRRLLDHLRV